MAKSIMIQGTMSNVGKSLLVGGLCRVFKQDGYKVAPFKAQNMALNSFVTKEGLEMGRAQVMQAEAAGIEPSVNMNPILLKPTDDKGSQVIVNGEVFKTMSAVEYYRNKTHFIPEIMKAYHSIEAKNDIIVLEGAGSPAEINLKENDIVNMKMAKMANSPVLIAGDIDRGGVFAQLFGTMALLTEDEKRYVKGLIINKFRGDKSILMNGIENLERLCGKDVIGIVPYLYVDIDDEDSLTERFAKKNIIGSVDIAVIRLPHISNFTDFNAFEHFDGVSLRYVSDLAALKNPDIIFIPGTKNTINDLLWMRQNGIETKIIQYAGLGKCIFGICGGYQMLGETLTDFDEQGFAKTIRGMGLLPVNTIFKEKKVRTRVLGKFGDIKGVLSELSGVRFDGYEIHTGISETDEKESYLTKIDSEIEKMDFNGKLDGSYKGNVYGSYVHGIFDTPDVAEKIITAIFNKKGIDIDSVYGFNMKEYKEKQYNMLADAIRESLDMEKIYKIIEIGV